MLSLIFALSAIVSCGGGGGGTTGSPNIPDAGVGEGTAVAPKSQGTAPISYNGAVGAFAESYYTFKTGSSSVMYTISATNIQTDLRWDLYSFSDFSGTLQHCDNSGAGGDESCTATLSGATDYYLKVDNSGNDVGSTYHLTIATTPVPAAPVITATAGHLQNSITWFLVAGATSYNLYASTSSTVSKTSYSLKVTSSGNPYIHGGLTQGTTYYYVVTAVNGNGESVESGVKSATPLAALASLSTNFDDGTLQGWTASGTWGVTTTASNSGSYSVTDSPAGNYGNYANMSLTSPVINLSLISAPTLTFYYKYDIENTYDHGYVDVSSDGGVTYTTAIAIYTGLQSSFVQVGIPLTSYKSSTVVVRFRFVSDFTNTVAHDGWYLDDITIQ